MASVEEGVEMPDIEVIPNASIARDFYLNAVKNAHEEIMIMFPTTNAFLRQYKMGAAQLAKESTQQRKVKVRILMPKHESTEQSVRSLTEDISPYSNYYIDIRYIEQTVLDTQATFLVVDRKVSLVTEIRDDSKTTFDEAIGLSTYYNSKAGVLSYVAIFENLWKQTELYEEIKEAHEELKLHDKAQKEFINVAAHELRTPIQPILGLSQILLSKTGSIQENNELLDTIYRNAKRLSRLTDDILDATRIESKSLELKKERFNLNDIIINVIDDTILGKDLVNSSNVQLLYEPKDIILEADKGRMSQVFSNLISNAIKFTKKGTITIATKIDEGNNQTIISVKDTGQGIDPEIWPRLFSKFAAKSETGTGLGLFISKSIVEAHDGKIWAKNNADGKGAKFSFSLPIKE
jgi:signal transduction histidine kinase